MEPLEGLGARCGDRHRRNKKQRASPPHPPPRPPGPAALARGCCGVHRIPPPSILPPTTISVRGNCGDGGDANFVRRGTYGADRAEMPPGAAGRGQGRAGGAGRGLRHTPGRGRAGAIGHPEPSITGGRARSPAGPRPGRPGSRRRAEAGSGREPRYRGGNGAGECRGPAPSRCLRRTRWGAGARSCPQTAAQHLGDRGAAAECPRGEGSAP